MSHGIKLLKYNSYLPTNRPFAPSYSHGKNGHDGEQKSHWDKTNEGNYHLKLCMFSCLSCPRATLLSPTPTRPAPAS